MTDTQDGSKQGVSVKATHRVLACVLFLTASSSALGQSLLPEGAVVPRSDLPGIHKLLDGVRAELIEQYDPTERLEGYVYRLDASEYDLDGDGRITDTETFEADVYGFDHGPFRLLLTENGAPLPEEEARKQQASFLRQVRGESARSPQQRPWLNSLGDAPEEKERVVADVLNGFEFTVEGREIIEGRSAIVVQFVPRSGVDYQSRVGEVVLGKVRGRVWIDEADHSLVRVDAEIVDDITFGPFGSFARVRPGTSYLREWRKVDGVWLPSSLAMTFGVRTLLFKNSYRQVEERYTRYRKFTVSPNFQLQFDD